MMIVTPTAQRASFFHESLPGLVGDSQIFEPRHRIKDTGRRNDCHDGLLFPPERRRTWTTFPIAQGEIVSTDSPG